MDFPQNPTQGQQFTAGERTWAWDGTIAGPAGVWKLQPVAQSDLDTVAQISQYDGGTLLDLLDQAKSLATYAALRSYSGRATTIRLTGRGVNGVFVRSTTDTASTDNGGTVIVDAMGRRWARLFEGPVCVKWFGAKGDNVTDDIEPIERATAYLYANGGGTLDMGSGPLTNYRLSRPWQLRTFMEITGTCLILPSTNFASNVVFPTYGTQVPQKYSCLAYFNNGTHADDPYNWGWGKGVKIGSGITFDGQYHVQVDNGLILEGMNYYTIEASFQQFASLGIWLKYYCWIGTVRSTITNCRNAFLKLGPAANGIDLNGLKCYGQNDTPPYGIIIAGDNNGINLSGAVVEKSETHLMLVDGVGPMTISGVDFEVSKYLLKVDGTAAIGRTAGPITLIGSYVAATETCIEAINATVNVIGCRVCIAKLAFKADLASTITYDVTTVIESSILKLAEGNVYGHSLVGQSLVIKNRTPYFYDTSPHLAYSLNNCTANNAPETATSYLNFSSQYANPDPAVQRYLASSTWAVRDVRMGVAFDEFGLVLDFLGGVKNVRPMDDGVTTLGTANKRFGPVFSSTNVISTSDATLKTEVSPLDAAELKAAVMLSREIGTYKWLDAVAAKGDAARTHIGMTVQRAIEVMTSCGLDPMAYAFICYDEYPAEYGPQLDAAGNPVYQQTMGWILQRDSNGDLVLDDNDQPFHLAGLVPLLGENGKPVSVQELKAPAGARYAFRYEQLLAFVARGVDERLRLLEERL